mmetsp:Transcript_157811/g.502571  ORF Transcript_157811/g.502571 Transcript_157811/m.502571 type:complete len:234 (+) Transcript_157811:746-1447(+)
MTGRRPAAGSRGGGLNVAPGLEELAGLGAGVRGDREGARQRAGQHPEADRHVGGGHIRDLGLERDVEARAEGGTVGEGGVGVRELEADETARRGHRGLVLLRDAAREAQVQDQVGIHELVVHAAHQQAVAERDRDGVPRCVRGGDGHPRECLHEPMYAPFASMAETATPAKTSTPQIFCEPHSLPVSREAFPVERPLCTVRPSSSKPMLSVMPWILVITALMSAAKDLATSAA